ncbi:ATP-binding protein [Hymenobacter busanensis]|uniref:ATP-binding protein n=1 Tax=Hymenobacter busanensis TaxID=2607656 RepID=A0A7L5A0E8_9BACT|nr:ATP-binding protein [Hymenobacter busanensis]KAA9338560.1 ATP-binding protein [Hymenobacter busanensis]QHJ09011.1 AAA family ATPase [Hymenobacter busanensis]
MLRIALTGPESTGKTTLSRQLAEQYHTVWAAEYAREYLESRNLGSHYTLADLEIIARGQLAAEEAAVAQAEAAGLPVVFCDTELLVIKVWAEHAFGACPEWILNEIEHRHYDLVLLLGVDIPWEPDPLREHPQLRQHFYELYRSELDSRLSNFAEISGDACRRLEQARFLVDELLLSHGFVPPQPAALES